MKFQDSDIGDSSDGEEQETLEKNYNEQDTKYLTHANDNLEKTYSKVSYLLKDIGGRLLHHQKITGVTDVVVRDSKVDIYRPKEVKEK